MKNFINEIEWRGMIHDKMPGIQEHIDGNSRTCYIGFDPTTIVRGSLNPTLLSEIHAFTASI